MKEYFNFFIMKFLFISFLILFTIFTSSYGQSLNTDFLEKYDLIFDDPYKFLLNEGIDIDKNMIRLSNLKRIRKKPTGHCKGGIYCDSNKTIYYVKKCRIFNEFTGSQLMNLLVGTEATPVVKVIKNHKRMAAAIKIKSFKIEKKTNTYYKNILNEVELQIAMDFLGLVDRHPRNMGYVRVNSRTLLAARIDFDACFDFESKKGYTSKSNHLSLKHLHSSIKIYPKDEIINAIRKIVDIPDQKIVMIIFESWLTLSRSGSNFQLERFLELAQKLIERKNLFREVLENPNNPTYRLLHQ